MARIQPARYEETDEPGGGRGGRRAMRFVVPVAVAGVAAATITLVPALADTGDPSLPSITAEQLLTKIAASDTQTVDGSVRFKADLGLPDVFSSGATSGLFSGGAAPSQGKSGSGKDSPAAPQSQLVQLLAGTHTLHVAADGQDRQKVSIIQPTAEYSIIHNGGQVWAYDSASNQAYHATVPQQGAKSAPQKLPEDFPATPQAAAQQVLKAAKGNASITVDGTAQVAGHKAYELLVTPQHADVTTVGSFRIAVDSKTGVPLKFTLTPKGGGKAIVDIGFTKVSFDKPAASTFNFTPPKGVKVTEGGDLAKSQSSGSSTDGQHRMSADGQSAMKAGAEPTVIGKGWDAIAVIKTPKGLPSNAGNHPGGKDPQSLLSGFGDKVSGAFGSGTVFHTRLVNVLMTDNGTVYVGAVTQSALTDAANSAAK
ncbi:LolA family protein [Streptomyces sp. CA-111067]|uniref:LolA family protein n=1 Tax=Streptomyces sp. CA-111067 TaxID=3240046 RepID=UPI003D98D733